MINELIKHKNEIMDYLQKHRIQKVDADEIFNQLALYILEKKPEIIDFTNWIQETLRVKIKQYKKERNKIKYEGDISWEQLQEQGIDPNAHIDPRIIIDNRELELLKEEKVNKLTSSQLKYFRLFEKKLLNKQIAKELNVTVQTVGDMRRRIQKLLKIKE